jgi:hypothetical protein
MARSTPQSNFTSDTHVLYAGWVLSKLRTTLGAAIVAPVLDDGGNITSYVDLHFADRATVRLQIPSPPPGWDPFDPAAEAVAAPSKKTPLDVVAPREDPS